MEPLDEDDEATESMGEPLEAGADVISTGDQQTVLDRQASKDLSLGSNGLWKSNAFIADVVVGPSAMEDSSGTDTDEEGIMIKQQQIRISQKMVGAGDGRYGIE